ncbi:MAG TPA: 16S rRNA (cytidine(1402)-2'-O)-methyltransferase [Limnochordia bacterium]
MLYLVSTPIGNLRDITVRALETLAEVDVIASEDTRKTGRLLKHYGIAKPQISFHEHNEERAGERILRMIKAGKSVAMVTTAGTPGISDPGFTLVRRAILAGVQVTAVPGPTAFVPALILSGLPVHAFTFRGFPPHKPLARRKFLAADRDSPHTLIYYESPHRLAAFLADAAEIFGERPAAVANDLTKLFESVARGSLLELARAFTGTTARGEYTVVIAGVGARVPTTVGGGAAPAAAHTSGEAPVCPQ